MRNALDAGTFAAAYAAFTDRYQPVANPTPVGPAQTPKGKR